MSTLIKVILGLVATGISLYIIYMIIAMAMGVIAMRGINKEMRKLDKKLRDEER